MTQLSAISMGIGVVGSAKTIIKRKFRWTFEIDTPYGYVPMHYVQVATFPQLEIEELEIPFLNVTTWLPGKAKWQPMTVSYLSTTDLAMKPLYDWIASIYNFQRSPQVNNNDSNQSNSSPKRYTQTEKGTFDGQSGTGWNAFAMLRSVDGCGNILEQFELGNIWPTSINFGGEGNFAESGALMLDFTFRYSDVDHTSPNGCSPIGTASCVGCQ